jgi:hypothetical protein
LNIYDLLLGDKKYGEWKYSRKTDDNEIEQNHSVNWKFKKNILEKSGFETKTEREHLNVMFSSKSCFKQKPSDPN